MSTYDFASIDGAFGMGTAAKAMLAKARLDEITSTRAASERRIRDDPRERNGKKNSEGPGF
jgi:hypothetical protein